MRLLVVALGLSLLLGCRPAPAPESKKLRVLTSILPVYCFAANVAGDRADVENLLTASADAHDFQFTPRERRQLDAADLVIINGLQMEPWLERALPRSTRARTVVACTAGLEPQLLHGSACLAHAGGAHDHAHADGFNPHVWLDPDLAARMVTNILAALQKADPANASAYATNAASYLARLRNLDQEIRDSLASLTHRSIVTSHDAFPYFARRYGLNVVGVLEEIPDVAPTPSHLASLRRAIEANRAPAIFTEPQHADKLARQFAADLKLRVAPLDTLETGELTPAAYEDGMRRNLRSLLEALR